MPPVHDWEESLRAWEAELPRHGAVIDDDLAPDYEGATEDEGAMLFFDYVVALKMDGCPN